MKIAHCLEKWLKDHLTPSEMRKFINLGKTIKKAQTKFFLGKKIFEDLNASKNN